MKFMETVSDEILYDIPDFEGLYEITKSGRIWDCLKERWLHAKRRNHVHDYYARVKGCVGLDREDFLCVSMVKDKKYYTRDVHRLVAKVFLPNEDGYKYVHHINFKRTDNRVENLVWVERPIKKPKKLYVKKPQVWNG